MSKKQLVTEDVEIKDVYFDFDNITAICLKRGVLKTDKSLAKEIGYTSVGFEKLKVKAPKAVAGLFNFLKSNDLRLEDLVKEVE
jgi:hypothetical protein